MERSVSSTSTKVKILTDDMELEPLLDFKDYGNAIVRIIKDSTPKFSVGIYGEWRTGKTTLMRFIESELKSNSSQADNNVLTVWFNAWRYEREEQFALIALMQTIAYAMGDIPVYHEIKKVLLRGLVIIGKDVMRNLTEKYFFMSKKGIDKLEQTLLHKMELLDKDTIYFDGFYKIEHEMEKLSQTNRIVVFIDDLDRCSPK